MRVIPCSLYSFSFKGVGLIVGWRGRRCLMNKAIKNKKQPASLWLFSKRRDELARRAYD